MNYDTYESNKKQQQDLVARGRAYPVEVYLYIPGFRTQVRALVAQRALVASARRELQEQRHGRPTPHIGGNRL